MLSPQASYRSLWKNHDRGPRSQQSENERSDLLVLTNSQVLIINIWLYPVHQQFQEALHGVTGHIEGAQCGLCVWDLCRCLKRIEEKSANQQMWIVFKKFLQMNTTTLSSPIS